jgi:hypothetical protein
MWTNGSLLIDGTVVKYWVKHYPTSLPRITESTADAFPRWSCV